MGLGALLRFTLFGESHGCCIGVVVEGVPPGIRVDENELRQELSRRKPGGKLVSPRAELDEARIVSGIYRGYTTGAPIAVVIYNRDVDSSFYEEIVKYKPRPGHADLAQRLAAMGFEDYRGGGYRSGRITAGIVAAGYFAKKILEAHGVGVVAYLRKLGWIECEVKPPIDPMSVYSSPVRCPNLDSETEMIKLLEEMIKEGDSVGGVVEAHAYNVPPGLGQPPLDALDADIAKAVISIPGVKAVEFDNGIAMTQLRGSELEEKIVVDDGHVATTMGITGGISTGSTIVVRAFFRPTSTIRKVKETIDWRTLEGTVIEGRGRHDPAIAVRGVAVVEAAIAIVLADHLLRRLSIATSHYYRLERGV